MRVAVIGATGHIGTYLTPRLVDAGHDVVAVSRGVRKPYHDSVAWQSIRHEIIDREAAEADGSFGNTIASFAPDAVVDLICFDVASATQLVDALRGRVKHLLHCGTLWVHRIPSSRPYDETTARRPFGQYGVMKEQVERYLLRAARDGFPVSVLHPGHITGPGWAPVNPAGNLDTAIFERLAQGATVMLPDSGLATLQHVHADDVALAFELAIAQPDAAIGEAFHVAAREPVTMREYAGAVASWFGRDATLGFLPWEQWRMTVTERAAAITHDHMLHSPHASIARAQSRLGFVPRFTALAAVRDALTEVLDGSGRNLTREPQSFRNG